MTTPNKKVKKLQQLKNSLQDLDWLKETIIKVIEQGGDVAFEWQNTGLINKHSVEGFVRTHNTGEQIFTFRIPPHNTEK